MFPFQRDGSGVVAVVQNTKTPYSTYDRVVQVRLSAGIDCGSIAEGIKKPCRVYDAVYRIPIWTKLL